MSSEKPEESYEPVLRLDYDLKAPGFFSYVRWAVRAKTARFHGLVVSEVSDETVRKALIAEVRSVSESFEKSVSTAEGISDKKKQSERLSSAVAEFNGSMGSLEVRLKKASRSQPFNKPSAPKLRFQDDELSLRAADASRFLEENGI